MSAAVNILLILLIVFIILFVALSFGLCYYATHVNRQSFETALAWQKDHYDTSFYDPLEKTDYKITSYDGYVIPVQFLKNPVPTSKYMLISHGHTDNHYGMLKYTKMYLDFGYNVILYDLRAHGENLKTICTFSIREAKDLDLIIKDCRERYPDMTQFGIHGESLGSATSIAVLKYKPKIDFVVADCGFAEIIPVMQGGLRGMHLPAFMVYPASLMSKLIYGYSFKDMRPIDSLKDNEIPILFIHGANDTYILPSHATKMHEADKGYSEVHFIEGAEHAGSVLTDPEGYRKIVGDFLAKL